jgi:Ca2+-binding EF-hand superfamily protein
MSTSCFGMKDKDIFISYCLFYVFLDRRDELMDNLTPEEMEAIKETFQSYDINSDGGISKEEMESLVAARTAERRKNIEEKFQMFSLDPGVSPEDIANAEHAKSQYLQQLLESRNKMIAMFNAADTNGDGIISFTEFIMAEAWWLRCTLNPDKAHLF